MRSLSLVRTLFSAPAVQGGRWVQVGYIVTDLFFIGLNALIVFYFRFIPDWLPALIRGESPGPFEYPFLPEYLGFLLLYAGLVVLFCQSQDLYRTLRTRSTLDESFAVFKAVSLATLLLTAFIYLSGIKTVSRLVVGFSGVMNVVCLVGWRVWKRNIVEHRVARGYGARNVLIVGAGKVGQELAQYFKDNKQLGYVVGGFLDSNQESDPRVLGGFEDLARVARAQFVDEIFITLPSKRDLVKKIAVEARQNRLDVKLVPDLYDGLVGRAPLEHLGDFPVMSLHWEPIPELGLLVKRAADVIVSAGGLILLSPLLAVIAVAIKWDSPGPVFHRSIRIGRKGRNFFCYKFRSMVANAEALKYGLRHLNERRGPTFKISNDPRITSVGCWLRKYSLDELPQLWNVLKGEMSLVGPRPHPVVDYEQYTLEHLRRLDVTPGLTGLWQISARRDPSFKRNMGLDLEYIENWDLWLDLKILLRTVPAVLRGQGQ